MKNHLMTIATLIFVFGCGGSAGPEGVTDNVPSPGRDAEPVVQDAGRPTATDGARADAPLVSLDAGADVIDAAMVPDDADADEPTGVHCVLPVSYAGKTDYSGCNGVVTDCLISWNGPGTPGFCSDKTTNIAKWCAPGTLCVVVCPGWNGATGTGWCQ